MIQQKIKRSGLYLEVWERFSLYKYLKNANHEKYCNVIKHLREGKGIGKDEFPKTITDAINTLNTYMTTKKESINKKKGIIFNKEMKIKTKITNIYQITWK